MSARESITAPPSGPSPVATLLLVAIVTAVFGKVVVGLARWMRIYWYLRKVPHPKERWPFSIALDMWQSLAKMDHNLEINARIFNYFEEAFTTIVDQEVTVVYYGPQPFLLASTPKAIEPMLTSSQNLNKPFLYEMLVPWMGTGILTLEKSAWRSRRKLVSPAFHFRVLKEYAPIMNRRAREMVCKLDAMEADFFDVLPVVRLAAFGILFETAFGVQIDEDEVKRTRLLEINDEIEATIMARMVNFFHWSDIIYSMTKESKGLKQNIKFIHEYNRRIVKQRIAEYKVGKVASDSKKSFLDILLHNHIVDGALTEEEVMNEVTSFFIGGFETTAASIAYTLFLLGNNPEVQEKLLGEIDSIFGEDKERDVTVEDMKQLIYMECVFKESMRIYPPLPLIARNVEEDMKVGEYTVPKGTVAIAAIYFLHRHSKYFEKPECFDPERFLNSTEKNQFTYIPFSGGSRNCIGQRFANMEEKILLTQILRRYTVTSKIPMNKLQLSFGLVLKAVQGLEIQIKTRGKVTIAA